MAKSEQKGVALKSIYALDFSGGVQNRTFPALANDNQLMHLLNGYIGKKIGGIIGRHGSVTKNTTGKTVDNIGIYRNGATRKYFVIADNTTHRVIHTVPNSDFSGTLTEVLAGHFSKTATVRSITFATREMFFNGVEAPQKWDGTTFSVITNAPVKAKYPVVFSQRLYAFGIDSYLHYSDVINATGDGFSTNTWTNVGVNPNDGQRPRGLVRHRARLILLKDESIYRFNGSSGEAEPIINIGTHSENGFVCTDTAMFFHHPNTGIWKMSLGDPTLISAAVDKYLKGMLVANWDNVAMGKDDQCIYAWIGNVTINDPLEWDYNKTYTDVCLVFDTQMERWTVFTGWNATKMLIDVDNSYSYFVTSVGKIIKIDKTVFNDDGVAVDFQVRWHPINYGMPQNSKSVDRLFIKASPDVILTAGSDQDKMTSVGQYDLPSKTCQIREMIDFYELHVGAHASYTERPVFIEQLFIGNSYARNTI